MEEDEKGRCSGGRGEKKGGETGDGEIKAIVVVQSTKRLQKI